MSIVTALRENEASPLVGYLRSVGDALPSLALFNVAITIMGMGLVACDHLGMAVAVPLLGWVLAGPVGAWAVHLSEAAIRHRPFRYRGAVGFRARARAVWYVGLLPAFALGSALAVLMGGWSRAAGGVFALGVDTVVVLYGVVCAPFAYGRYLNRQRGLVLAAGAVADAGRNLPRTAMWAGVVVIMTVTYAMFSLRCLLVAPALALILAATELRPAVRTMEDNS